MRPYIIKSFLRIIFLIVLLCVGGLAAVSYPLGQPLPVSADGYVLIVQNGATLSRVARDLGDAKLLAVPVALVWYGKLTKQTLVHAGEYRISLGMTPRDLLRDMVAGKVIERTVTLIEGWNIRDVLRALHQQAGIVPKLNEGQWQEIASTLGLQLPHPEGWFFPDSYRYNNGMSDIDILLLAHRRMKDVLDEEWQQRATGLPFANSYQALIMASLIEKETGAASERSEIAGVFIRRLQLGMRLQTDPTVIYGMGEQYHGNITRADLQRSTPYNTYLIDGMPPTPICSPGRAAIHAALHPAAGNALYFVGKGDGSHYFSATLAEHQAAVQRYQIQQRSTTYHSAPQP